MFAFDKACISTKEKEAEKKKRPVPGSPVYRPVHMPGPMQAQNARIGKLKEKTSLGHKRRMKR